MRSSYNAEYRRQQIVDFIRIKDSVNVSELSKFFKTTEATIRSDLRTLESKGLLKRTHGGAVRTEENLYNFSYVTRIKKNIEEKIKIGRKAAELIDDGDSIILDSGTTTLCIANELKNKKNITVVTNSLPVIHETGHMENIQLLVMGGSYSWRYKSIIGSFAINQLKRYRVNKLFLCVDGISANYGITNNDYNESEMSREMIYNSQKVYVVADHSKIGKVAFSYVDKAEKIDVLITDEKADKEELKLLSDLGIEIIVV